MRAGGQLTTKWIHAKQYRVTDPQSQFEVDSLVSWMNDHNPDFEFRTKDITGTGHDMYRNEAA
jgi:hypothetical protein